MRRLNRPRQGRSSERPGPGSDTEHRPEPVDTSCESVAGEEDPGAAAEVPGDVNPPAPRAPQEPR